jgi:hypothetical protein
VRVAGADVNPYLAVAASLACGLYGIEKGLALEEPPIKGSAYREAKGERLPRDLHEATTRLSAIEAGARAPGRRDGGPLRDHAARGSGSSSETRSRTGSCAATSRII